MDLLSLPIRELRSSIDSGSLSCESLLRACLARIDAREPEVGAWERIDRDGAMAAARTLDKGSTKGLLHGLPMGVKDIIDVAGMPTRMGSPIYAKAPAAAQDASCVNIARSSGAVILGKTVTTELATFQPAKTRNPLRPEHTPGGSSSGSAAAVADGHVPLAIGTQTAGSIIRPAAFCGVVGFKPSFGLIPRNGVKMQSESLDTIGVFTRSIDDAAIWYAAMTGSRKMPDPSGATGRTLRIAVVTNWLDQAEMEMNLAVAEAAHAISTTGAKVREVQLSPLYVDAHNDQRIIQLAEMARLYADEYHQHNELLSLKLLELIGEGDGISKEAYKAAVARTETVRKAAAVQFNDYDAWLLPSAADAAPRTLDSTGDPLFNRLATTLQLPCINLPHYRNKAGMPLGLQLVGARQQDEKLLEISAQIAYILHTSE